MEAEPKSPFYHANLGIAYAGVGRAADAVREGIVGTELLPISTDLVQGPARVAALAEIYVMFGQYDEAVDQLELLLSHPNYIRAGWLRLDPIWDPLRNDPRFQALLEKYDQPAG